MKYLRQLSIILLMCFIGELIHRFSGVPIPGNVLGMILLFLLLCTKIIKLEAVEEVSEFLLKHLAFFFIPAGVAIMTSFSEIKSSLIPVLAIVFISTVVVMATTGVTLQLLRGDKKHEGID